MNDRDPHSALRSEVVKKINAGHLEVVLARLQWGKDDTGYSLHVNPTSFSTAGLQTTDFLGYLGFQRSDRCSFTGFQRCYCRWVDEGFSVEEFATAFNGGYGHLGGAQRALEACGFLLPQPEGWGFYHGKPGGRTHRGPDAISGDGHTAMKVEHMKSTEDDRFKFRFTFMETGREKAFVTHYKPKHLPVSSEVSGVFGYLGLKEFRDCPEFDFEPCYFRSLRFVPRGVDMRGGNVEFAHGAFDAHATQFSPGIESLLAANASVEVVGMSFLRLSRPADRMKADIATKVIRPAKAGALRTSAAAKTSSPAIPDSFDVAISFAGTERGHAQQLAEALRAAGYAVFYDDFYPEQLWGKNLTVFFDEIFRKKARYCVMFISKEYQARKWTIHEARSAQARALEEKGNEYILPIRVDDTKLEGLLPTIGYVPIANGIEFLACSGRYEMSKAQCEFGFLDECEARLLVRVKIEDSGEWAIVGARDRPIFPLVVLTGADAPYCINLYQNGHIDGDFDTYAVLKCGTDYEIMPDHAGLCEIGVGQTLRRAGSFVLADADQYLVVGSRGQKATRYFDLATGKLHGEPGGSTAWFAGWTLRSRLMKPIADSGQLIKFPPGV